VSGRCWFGAAHASQPSINWKFIYVKYNFFLL
jgi:hypothetical protein